MRKNLCVGILRETRDEEQRVPLTPADVNWLIRRGISVEVESSHTRIFKDQMYRKSGARIVDRFSKASFLLGIKTPRTEDLYANKIYMIFSHTLKGQFQNIPFLKTCLRKDITLIDYEKITDSFGRRLVYFGRFAGICGAVDSLFYFGKKLEWKGLRNPFSSLKPANEYSSLKALKQSVIKAADIIHRKGIQKKISPFIIGITGHGHVSEGAQEILELLDPIEIHPKDMLRFVRHQKKMLRHLYKIVFLREEKLRAKNQKGFYFEEYLQHPERFESNLDKFIPYINVLIHGSYWDKRYPRLITKEMVHRLARKSCFRLDFIGDISCDIKGSIELTYKTTTRQNPTYTYDPIRRKYTAGYMSKGITIFALDNLPSELSVDASSEFSSLIREYVYQVAAHGTEKITRHIAIPAEIRRATVVQNGKLTKDFNYLKIYI